MNKTININLANTFFHIDEDAYNKLQRYLDAIKRSFTNSQGRDEILSDIEARIAELFTEKIQNERQVITTKEVEDVIAVMGQPEDYLVDEEIFDDQPRTKSAPRREVKQLYRDTENKYIAGVSSGLAHYLGIDAIWMRLLWVILALASGFTFVFIYIIFWILVPEAETTAQKLAMKGEAVNISNIEKKIKEGFDEVADKVKSVDYEKVGDRVKSGSKSFFDTIGNIIMFMLKLIGKFIGIILLIVSASVLISLFIGLFTAGTLDFMGDGQPWSEYINIATDAPVWLLSILIFFAVGIPFFFLFYLGLKILVNNLKSLGRIAKFSLLGLWLLSIIGLTTLGVRTATDHAFTGTVNNNESYALNSSDTLLVAMAENDTYKHLYYYNSNFDIVTEGDDKLIYSEFVKLSIEQSTDSLMHVNIIKEANGRNHDDAHNRAEAINYSFTMDGSRLKLNNYLTSPYEHKFRDQEVRISLLLPEGSIVKFDPDFPTHRIAYRTRSEMGSYKNQIREHSWQMTDGRLNCMDCSDEDWKQEDEDTESHFKLDENGLEIKNNKSGNSFKMKIDSNGVKINTN